ncbi:hypothetical protein IMZ48_19520 [Candidatus Bathyarchaeota archaeon]|nr:hypothetical protein [Candidatus Bathyarchaeota archaeon]
MAQASVNYEHVAGGFADALCSISENVAFWEVELEIFRTKAVLEKVADFYAHVFVFLSTFMDWMTRKRRMRLLDSFNEKASSTFDSDIQALSEKAAAIRHIVEQSSRAEVRATRLTAEGTQVSLEGLARDVRVGLQGMARQQAEMEYTARRWAAMQEKANEERQRWVENPKGFEDRLLALIKHSLVDEARVFVRNEPAKAGR